MRRFSSGRLLGWAVLLPRLVLRLESLDPDSPPVFSARLVWDLARWSL